MADPDTRMAGSDTYGGCDGVRGASSSIREHSLADVAVFESSELIEAADAGPRVIRAMARRTREAASGSTRPSRISDAPRRQDPRYTRRFSDRTKPSKPPGCRSRRCRRRTWRSCAGPTRLSSRGDKRCRLNLFAPDVGDGLRHAGLPGSPRCLGGRGTGVYSMRLPTWHESALRSRRSSKPGHRSSAVTRARGRGRASGAEVV